MVAISIEAAAAPEVKPSQELQKLYQAIGARFGFLRDAGQERKVLKVESGKDIEVFDGKIYKTKCTKVSVNGKKLAVRVDFSPINKHGFNQDYVVPTHRYTLYGEFQEEEVMLTISERSLKDVRSHEVNLSIGGEDMDLNDFLFQKVSETLELKVEY